MPPGPPGGGPGIPPGGGPESAQPTDSRLGESSRQPIQRRRVDFDLFLISRVMVGRSNRVADWGPIADRRIKIAASTVEIWAA
jgi:hypothetical protein